MLSKDAIFVVSYIGLVFFISLSLSLILVPFSNRLARLLGVLDYPDSRKVHLEPIPRMGGLAMVISMIIAIFLCTNPVGEVKAFVIGAGIVSFTGLLDDKFHISPTLKLVGQVLASVAFMFGSGFHVHDLGDIFGFGNIHTGYLAPFFTVFCMVGVINAVNLSDGLDGLAGGIGLIVSMFMAVLAFKYGQPEALLVALVLMGILIGFLRYNHYPAKLFMGDAGSLLIGYSLAAIAICLVQKEGPEAVHPVTPAIFLGLPIMDTLWVMGRRVINRKNPFSPDKGHFHHRLLNVGMGHAGTVTIVYGLTVFLGFWAWSGRNLPDWVQFWSTILFFALLYAGLRIAERKEVNFSVLIRSFRFRPKISMKAKPLVWRKMFKMAPVVLIAFLALPTLLVLPVPRIIGIFSSGAALFVALMYPWGAGRKHLTISHAVLYVASFFLLLIGRFSPNRPSWLIPLSYLLTGLALTWILLRLLTSRQDPILYPSGFEILIICFSWTVSFLVIPALNIKDVTRIGVMIACLQSLPWLVLIKLLVRRHRHKNAVAAISFLCLFLFLAVAAFLRLGFPDSV